MQSLLGDATAPYRLCNDHNKLVGRKRLGRNSNRVKIKNGSYIFIVNGQNEIIYYPNIQKQFRVCDGQGASPEIMAIRKPFNHTNLAWNSPVQSAGEFVYLDGTIILNNKSGHYLPPESTLNIPGQIVQRLGYNVVLQPYTPEDIDFDFDVDNFVDSDPSDGYLDFDTPRDFGFGGKRNRQKTKRKLRVKRFI